MKAIHATNALRHALDERGIDISFEDAQTLRRAEMTLHRWAELQCGMGDSYRSYCIVRDDDTGRPFMEVHPHRGESFRYRIADREAGALRRVKDVCERNGLHFYHQTDPRGCALYVSREPIGYDHLGTIPCSI